MAAQEYHNHTPESLKARFAKRFPLLLCVVYVFGCSSVRAEDFVPFVIPAKPNLDSPIAVTSFESIETNDDYLLAKDGRFLRGGKRVRIWGVNLSFGANMPKHEDAPHIAARMATAGINSVRCHHMDTSRWPRGLWNSKDGKTIEPEALDRLDFFIDQLARHGICVNINLHVGRAHSRYLDLPQANRQYDKISNIFTPALIDAQKEFARQLLTRVNPYRKVRYADDPAVAFVEITNENSFFMWGSEETLRTLPAYYSNILQKKFNVWLSRQYGSNEQLRKAWSEGVQPLGTNLLTNPNLDATGGDGRIPKGWQLEQHSGCKASLSRRRHQGRDAVCITIDKADQTEWHLQFKQGGLSLEAGRYYTVIFEAVADKPRKVGCGVSQAQSPWANLGLSRQVELGPKWQTFRFGFVAKADEDNARVSFAFGGSNVPLYLASVELHPGGRSGLSKGESIQTGNVTLFADNESPQRTIDRMRFLAETEKAYFDEMRNFIKNDLGCKALVTGTIVFGPLGLFAQSDMDFIDGHAYWQHPRFPGRPWDSGNWLVNQKPMTDYPAEATLFRLAAERLSGKPFTVSEYNHPAPLDSQVECVPMVASFAAAQDWDGVWLYTYSHSTDEWDREHMNSYFDIDTNPGKWGFMRAGAAIFLDRTIEPLNGFNLFGLRDSSGILTSLTQSHLKYDRDMFSSLSEPANMNRDDMLNSQISRSLTITGGYGRQDTIGTSAKLNWSVEDGKGFYAARGRSASVYTGHAGRFAAATDGQISIVAPDFLAVAMTALDKEPWISLDQSRKILITACGRCENTGMKFSKDRRTVGRNWGGPPVRIETVKGTVVLPAGRWKCEALGPDGMFSREVPISYRDGKGILELAPQHETMWYLLTR